MCLRTTENYWGKKSHFTLESYPFSLALFLFLFLFILSFLSPPSLPPSLLLSLSFLSFLTVSLHRVLAVLELTT